MTSQEHRTTYEGPEPAGRTEIAPPAEILIATVDILNAMAQQLKIGQERVFFQWDTEDDKIGTNGSQDQLVESLFQVGKRLLIPSAEWINNGGAKQLLEVTLSSSLVDPGYTQNRAAEGWHIESHSPEEGIRRKVIVADALPYETVVGSVDNNSPLGLAIRQHAYEDITYGDVVDHAIDTGDIHVHPTRPDAAYGFTNVDPHRGMRNNTDEPLLRTALEVEQLSSR